MHSFTSERDRKEIKPHTCVKRQSTKVNSMSGDSPNPHKNELFVFLDGRAPLQPLTPILSPASKDVAVQSGSGGICLYSAAISIDERCRDDDDKGTCSPLISTRTYEDSRSSDNDKTPPVLDSLSPGKTKKDRRKMKLCKKEKGNYKVQDDDDEWTVNCLYYTLQCCDCSIM